eukprot:jgi/Chlat1/3544/Chrsp231S03544
MTTEAESADKVGNAPPAGEARTTPESHNYTITTSPASSAHMSVPTVSAAGGGAEEAAATTAAPALPPHPILVDNNTVTTSPAACAHIAGPTAAADGVAGEAAGVSEREVPGLDTHNNEQAPAPGMQLALAPQHNIDVTALGGEEAWHHFIRAGQLCHIRFQSLTSDKASVVQEAVMQLRAVTNVTLDELEKEEALLQRLKNQRDNCGDKRTAALQRSKEAAAALPTAAANAKGNLQTQLSNLTAEHKQLDQAHTVWVKQVQEKEAVIDNIDAQLNVNADEFYRFMGYPLPGVPSPEVPNVLAVPNAAANNQAARGDTRTTAAKHKRKKSGASPFKRQRSRRRQPLVLDAPQPASSVCPPTRAEVVGCPSARRIATAQVPSPSARFASIRSQQSCYWPRLLPFSRLVREVCNDGHATRGNEPYRWTSEAMLAMQEAAEAFLVSLLEKANLAAIHRKRVTLTKDDMKLVRKIDLSMADYANLHF